MDYLKNSKIINNSTIDLKNINVKEPVIFASFHLGSYRKFNSILYELGHKIVIVIDESFYIKQQENIINNVAPLLKGKVSSDFIILNVMDKTSIFKLKHLIKNGYVMSIYLDGNTGINSDNVTFSKSYIPINFLNNIIYVKNGIGKLAALLGAKIVPIIAHRDEEENNNIVFYKEIEILEFENKQNFAIRSIEEAYKLFEIMLNTYPTQWESWLYIHKWFKRGFTTSFIERRSNSIDYNFNHDRYALFKLVDSFFLFDLFDYQSYPITQELSDIFKHKNFSKLNRSFLEELIKKNILQ